MNFERDQLDQLYRFALALTGQRQDAEDLLHACLAEFLERSRNHVDAPLPYLRQMLRSRFYDGLRRRHKVQYEPIYDAVLPIDPQPALEAAVVDALTLSQVWQDLTAAEREVMYLWAVDGLSANEIALQLGQPRGSVLSRMHRVRKRLQEKFPTLVEGQDHA